MPASCLGTFNNLEGLQSLGDAGSLRNAGGKQWFGVVRASAGRCLDNGGGEVGAAGVSLKISWGNDAGGRLRGCNSLDRSSMLENYDPRHATLFIILETGTWNTQVWCVVYNWICLGAALQFLGVGEGSWAGGRVTVAAWWWSSFSAKLCSPPHLTLTTNQRWWPTRRLFLCSPFRERKGASLQCFNQESMHVAMAIIIIAKTLNYTAPMAFESRFAASADPGEFESMMQILSLF